MANKTIGQLNYLQQTIDEDDKLILFRPADASIVTTQSGATYRVRVGDLPFGQGSGLNNIQDTENGGIQLSNGLSTASGNYAFALSTGAYAPGNNSFALGTSTASGSNSLAIGLETHANRSGSFTCGSRTKASYNSVAEGDRSEAGGSASHAEGHETHTYASWSHTQGIGSETRAMGSHAEGASKTTGDAYVAHAEGFNTTAASTAAHAEGYYTIANSAYQHVFGKFNSTISNIAEIVGNGTSTASRSNARTLDWNGNEWLAGNLTVASSYAVQPEFRHYKTSIYGNRQFSTATVIGDNSYVPTNNYFIPLHKESGSTQPKAIPILHKGLVKISGTCNIVPASTNCFAGATQSAVWPDTSRSILTVTMSIFASTNSNLTTYNGSSNFDLINQEYEVKLPLTSLPSSRTTNTRIPFNFTIPSRLIGDTDNIYLYGFLGTGSWPSDLSVSTASTNFLLDTGFTVENIYATELSYSE